MAKSEKNRFRQNPSAKPKADQNYQSDSQLTQNALEVLRQRYLLKNDSDQIIETPDQLFQRVARAIAAPQENFTSEPDTQETFEKFCSMMSNLEFLPNSPTLMNAGTAHNQLSACFVLPIEDSIESIFETLKNMALIHQTGGGTGFNFSALRPRHDPAIKTKGLASGPVSFMTVFDKATEVIMQGGRRRGANMAIINCDHPDIIDFVRAKTTPKMLENFNVSVAVTDEFMQKVDRDSNFQLKNPRTGRKHTIQARFLFDLIVDSAWQSGEPGLIFIDQINRHNPTPSMGPIISTNPCGELPLLPYESCNLGSINLTKMLLPDSSDIDWPKLTDTIKWAVRFLDNVIEQNHFILPQIEKITTANRKIGLGIMGFADMLIMLKIKYDSTKALELASKLMRFIQAQSRKASVELARTRGSFPNFPESIYADTYQHLRNATVNTVAPTGTISMIAGCSSGIEPLFGLSFIRNVMSGTTLSETNRLFEQTLKDRGLYDPEILSEIAEKGSIRKAEHLPQDLKNLFVTAHDITPIDHLEIQAAFQRFTDNAVSKTINLPAEATIEDVRDIYIAAHKFHCKGITVYRYGSREKQVLSYSAAQANEIKTAAEDIGCKTGYCF